MEDVGSIIGRAGKPSIPSVLMSAKFIVSRAQHVTISQDGVMQTARKLLGNMENEGVGSVKGAYVDPLEPPGLNKEEVLEWLFLLDTLNFCFWSDSPALFTVRHQDRLWTGFRSMCAALARAVQAGLPVYRPSVYGSMTLEQFRGIFQSETDVPIPLLERRLRNLHEAAAVLNEKFGGSVSELVQQSRNSAQRLVSLLVHNFSSFHDFSTYHGRKVSFLKRAQIFAADVWARFGGEGYGEFHDIDSLTMFADYRVPQCLQYLGVLVYEEGLLKRLREGEHLEPGCAEEAEIRGSSIWAVELVKEKMKEIHLQENGSPLLVSVNSVTLDYYLWNYAKLHSERMSHCPIHRTLTVFY